VPPPAHICRNLTLRPYPRVCEKYIFITFDACVGLLDNETPTYLISAPSTHISVTFIHYLMCPFYLIFIVDLLFYEGVTILLLLLSKPPQGVSDLWFLTKILRQIFLVLYFDLSWYTLRIHFYTFLLLLCYYLFLLL